MQRIWNVFAWLLLAFAVTSCLTVEEHYTFNQDGSGQMELAFDLKQLAMFVEEGPQRDSLFMMGEVFGEITPQLDEMDGITRIETFEDRENMRLGLRFDFRDVAALNAALNSVLILEGGDEHMFFTREKDQYQRVGPSAGQGITLIDAVAQSFMGEGGDPQEAETVLGMMKYKTLYRFPKRVKLVYAEAEADVTGDEHDRVELGSTFSELLKDRDELDAAFVLK